jgi:small-conductance mechanosensitive channel
MDTALLNAAFRLLSHSVTKQVARFNLLTTDDARLTELRKQFPESDPQTLKEAHTRAQRLEEVAIAMADLARGPRNDNSGPPLNEQTLEARCPGFSSESYVWAINDGYVLTRN